MSRPERYTEARRQERLDHAMFVRQFADEKYKDLQRVLLKDWSDWNKEFFGRLIEPHIDFACTPPRSLVTCSKFDGSGGDMLITLKDSIVFGTHPGVIRPWPSEGADRFIRDLFLRGVLDQYVLEELAPEKGYASVFAEEATRVGIRLGLGAVIARDRPGKDRKPLAKHWPHCVRARNYYLGDIGEDLLDLARGDGSASRPLTTPNEGVLEFLRFLLTMGRADEALRLLNRHLEWLARFQASRRTRIPRPEPGVEEGHRDLDGSPLGEVSLAPAWLKWNGGTVLRMAQSIRRWRCFADLPILADALEEAGCQDTKILRHLRARMAHNRACWALRLILALEDEDEQCIARGEETAEGGEG